MVLTHFLSGTKWNSVEQGEGAPEQMERNWGSYGTDIFDKTIYIRELGFCSFCSACTRELVSDSVESIYFIF
jgi:hypothetical protein